MNQIAKTISSLTLALMASVAIARNGVISGTITDAKGSPLTDVRIQIMGLEKLHDGKWVREMRLGDMAVFKSQKDGRFEIPLAEPDVRYDLCFDKDGFAPAFLSEVSVESSPLSVVLERGTTVTGHVIHIVDMTPQPVAGAKVELQLPGPDFWYQKSATTDSNGTYSFRVTEPPKGRNWFIKFGSNGVPFAVEGSEPINGPDFTN
jgi:hypothetical protein